MGRAATTPNPDGVLANIEEYDMSPMSFAGEKVVTSEKGSLLVSLMAIIVGRMREKKIPISGLGRALGLKAPWLVNLYAGTQRDAYVGTVLAVIDGLGLEVVIRPKPGMNRSSKPSSLKATKLLREKATEQQPKVIVVEVDRPTKHDPTGVISPQTRAEIDKMLAS